MRLSFVLCVWGNVTDKPLLEARSYDLTPDSVRTALDIKKDPADPDLVVVRELTAVQGRRILELMGIEFNGIGIFHLEREHG